MEFLLFLSPRFNYKSLFCSLVQCGRASEGLVWRAQHGMLPNRLVFFRVSLDTFLRVHFRLDHFRGRLLSTSTICLQAAKRTGARQLGRVILFLIGIVYLV